MSARRTTALAGVALFSAALLLGCTAPAPAESPESGDSPAEEAPTTETGGDCLVGNWTIGQDQLNAFYDQVAAESGEGLSFDVEGDTALNFTATTYEYLPRFSLVLDMAGTSGRGDVTGSVRGDYTAADGILTTENDTSDLNLQVDVGGVTMDGSELGNEIIASQPINDVTYRCEAGAPVIDFKTGSSTIPLTLTAG
jgi:hypothetical protein